MKDFLKKLLVLFALSSGLSCEQFPELKLKLVQILFRHGDRAPLYTFPYDNNDPNFWKLGISELTMLGRKQHYELGKFLRSMYRNFITTNPLEINVTSSDSHRCIISAQSLTATFYAPDPPYRFEEHLTWQPIPIYYLPKEQNKYLSVDSPCPRAEKEQKRQMYSPENVKRMEKYKEMLMFWSKHSGIPIRDWFFVYLLHDTLMIEKKYNLSVPEWANVYWDEMSHISDRLFHWVFNSILLHRLRIGPLFSLVIEKMKDKISGKLKEKVELYSGHDESIALLLDALHLYNMKAVPYCSCVIFEMYEMRGTHFVRLLYQNSTNPEYGIHDDAHVLKLDGCSEYCPTERFFKLLNPLIPEDWEKECNS